MIVNGNKIYLEDKDVELLADELEDDLGITLDNNNCIDNNIISVEKLNNMLIKYFSADYWYPLIESENITMKSVLIPLTDKQMNNIINNIDCPEFNEYIKKISNDKVFVKLSSVSPKDVVNPYATTSKEIVYILSKSPRVVNALKNNNWKNYLFIREYWNFIPDLPEFRVFITNRFCIAISQNNLINCILKEEEIKDKIVKFCRKIINKLWYYDFTIDICYDHKDDKLYMIEINTPYYLIACSSLYNQDNPCDESILRGDFYNEYGTNIRISNIII